MDVLTAIKNRQSVREFLAKPVDDAIILEILDVARFAPSGVNTQPWHVTLVGPKARKQINNDIINARENKIPENPDYQYYPEEWVEPYKTRRKECGMALYGALDIKIDETAKRKAQWYKNYDFFGAPVGLIISIEKIMCKGSWLDLGLFIQSIMLAARHFDLETCPQASLAEYPDIVRKHLNINPKQHIACGIALGYANWQAPVNNYRTTRIPLSEFFTKSD